MCFVSSFCFALCLATITTVVKLDFDGDNSLNDSIWFQSPVFNTFLKVKVLKVKVAQSCPSLCDTGDYTVHGILQARILEWVAFPFSRRSSLGWNPGLWNYRQILYQLSHKGSPRILEWVAYPVSRGSSQPRTLLRFTFFLI